MSFSADQNAELAKPLSKSFVKSREQGGRQVSYVEGWHAIAEANMIFGFDGWSRQTIEIKCVSEGPREIGKSKMPGFGVSYIARVRILVGDTIRDGCGTGHGIDRDLGQAHESAIKEAETDAMKRALMTFGNPFGLALYDKTQANVADEVDEAREKFLQVTRAVIGTASDGRALLEWWNSEAQKNLRRDFELTKMEVDALVGLVTKRRDELKQKEAA
jgi:DNA repair and recombination protein RAD52